LLDPRLVDPRPTLTHVGTYVELMLFKQVEFDSKQTTIVKAFYKKSLK